MAKLVLKLNDATLDEFVVRQGNMTIGRRPDNDIVIENLAVSGKHAALFTAGPECVIEDLQSTNGIFINNKRVTRQHLADGDTILIGKHVLLFQSGPANAEDSSLETAPPAVDVFSHSETPVPAPRKPLHPPRQGALFILTGPNSGKRIDLTKVTTYLGKTGKPAGAVIQTPQGYRLRPAEDTEIPQVNGRPISLYGVELKNGDIIEVADTRVQFYLK